MTCFTAVGSSCGSKLTLATSQVLLTRVAVGPAGDALVGLRSPGGRVLALPPGAGFPGPAHTVSPLAVLPHLGVDAAGNGVAVWPEGDTTLAAGYDAAPPVIQSVSVPSVVERTEPTPASVAVFDVWGATSQWSFGDGGTATGATVQHVFARTGTFDVQVMATDGAGASVSAQRRVTVVDTRPQRRIPPDRVLREDRRPSPEAGRPPGRRSSRGRLGKPLERRSTRFKIVR